MGQLRFIHAADLHLGSPFTGMKGLKKDQWNKLKDSTLDAFDRLIDYTVDVKPDLLLIVGDIYDGEDRSIRAQYRFQAGMQRLFRADIPVVISHGNHDHLSGNWPRFDLPDNVRVFDSSVSRFSLATQNGDVHITGFSYGQRHIKESIVDQFPAADYSEAFHIGMLHGSLEGDTAHAVYAPFTKQQLLSKNYDYWALGHIHKRQVLHTEPAIVYPGNLQGRHRNESGPKGFYDVKLSKTGTDMEFVPVSAIQFGVIQIDCSGVLHMNELLDECLQQVEDFAADRGAGIIELQFCQLDEGAMDLFAELPENGLIETIRESLEGMDEFVWLQKVSFDKAQQEMDLSPLGEEIISAMERWELADWKDVLKDLYRHPKGSRFLEALDEAETAEIRHGAVQKIRSGMQSGSDL